MPKYTEAATDNWKPSPSSITKYGKDAASKFEVISGVRSELQSAFDLLSEKAYAMPQAANATYAFDFLWSLINDEHDALLKQVEARS